MIDFIGLPEPGFAVLSAGPPKPLALYSCRDLRLRTIPAAGSIGAIPPPNRFGIRCDSSRRPSTPQAVGSIALSRLPC